MTRRVCVVTGTRAEFGLLRWLMAGIRDHAELDLQVAVTGAHLSEAHGMTVREVEAAGFTVDARIDIALSGDTVVDVGRSMGLGVAGFSEAFSRLAPDLVVLLGDRYEMLAAACAATVVCVPVVHLHGGEVTEGVNDDAMRHAITKLSHVHCVATEDARQRVLQMGEQTDLVFLVGGLGVDAITKVLLLPREVLERELGLTFAQRNLLVTFHPVTLEGQSSAAQMCALLDALGALRDTRLIFTLPNADVGNAELARMVTDFVASHPLASAHASLGQQRYLSCMAQVDAVVGNSSSGLLEAPSFRIATIDIGNRQQGRPRASSVLHCAPTPDAIAGALRTLYSSPFRDALACTVNPYGEGGAAARIVRLLASLPLENLARKRFNDLDCGIAGPHDPVRQGMVRR